MRHASGIALVLVALAAAPRARADELAEVSLAAWDARDGTARPHRYVLSVRAATSVEVVADRRLLTLEVRPEGARVAARCAHPRAPTAVDASRTRALAPGEAWQEWIDLREYCAGRALAALEGGAEVRATYGWRRATARRWVARSAPRQAVGSLAAPPVAFAALDARTTTMRQGDEWVPAPLEVALAPSTITRGAALVLSVTVRAHDRGGRAYVRPESFSFRVRGPAGDFTCRLAPWGGAPVADLYQRIGRRGWTERLDARVLCPPRAFDRAGLYEVTPKLRLDHRGAEWGLAAITGRFVGPAVPLRVVGGAHVEQALPAPEPGDG
ncbi:MAG: hypothetical protein KF729_21285 [Sandaracinaceae bacterium]|nr:hypothetical protein [Sandaracinaceae bacterium]